MIAVRQTKKGGPDVPPAERGDCLAACIASILEVDLDRVPSTDYHAAVDWWPALQAILARLDHTLVEIDPAMLGKPWLDPPACYWIASVPSLNLGDDECGPCGGRGCVDCDHEGVRPIPHCIVAHGLYVAHDPSMGPVRYLGRQPLPWRLVRSGWVLVPLGVAP